MLGIWGAPHAPKSDATAIRENTRAPNQEDAGYLGSQPQAPNISDGVYLGVAQAPGCIWGVPHTPKSDAAAIRGAALGFAASLCEEPNQKDAGYLGSQPQAPNISDGVYLGVAQAPRCIWGAPHTSNVRRCSYSGECPNPNQEDASYLGSQPQAPNISDGVYLGDAQAPRCLWGEPHAPDIIFHFSLFILHSTFLFS